MRLNPFVKIFKKHGEGDAHVINWVMLAAVAFQESRFNSKLRSPAGAVGLMQIRRDSRGHTSGIIQALQRVHGSWFKVRERGGKARPNAVLELARGGPRNKDDQRFRFLLRWLRVNRIKVEVVGLRSSYATAAKT